MVVWIGLWCGYGLVLGVCVVTVYEVPGRLLKAGVVVCSIGLGPALWAVMPVILTAWEWVSAWQRRRLYARYPRALR